MVTTQNSNLHNQVQPQEDDHHFDFNTLDQPPSLKVKGASKSADQKLRSKHSETEQRRRSKINERFQLLRELIPENDQKRDKATFLLEVIQYIQFLKEKLQFYEGSQGTHQGWSPEPSKLMPWRSNHHAVESFGGEQSPLSRDSLNQEYNIAGSSTLFSNAQNSVESYLSDEAVYKLMDHNHSSVDHAIPVNMSLQPNVLVDTCVQPCEYFPVAENLNVPSGFPYVASKWTADCTTNSGPSIDLENLRSNSGGASISNAYSQGLVNTLTRALQSSGVDLSEASISAQLDVIKQENPGSRVATGFIKDQQGGQSTVQYATSSGNYDHSNKRLRMEEK